MLSKETKKLINTYLKSVKKSIRNRSNGEKLELLRSMEEHIYGALDARFSKSPTLAEVQSVLDEMDPPESFQTDDSSDSSSFDRKLGKWALIVLVSGISIPLLILLITELAGVTRNITIIVIFLGIFMTVVALAIGIASRRSPAGKAAIIASAILLGSITIFLPVTSIFTIDNASTSSRDYIDPDHPQE